VEPDDFGPKIEERSSLTVEGQEGGNGGVAIGAEFSYPSPATVSQPAQFSAKVTDPNNKGLPHVQYKYVWEFGDGAKLEGSGGRELKAEHAYIREGRYEVKLTVIDEGGRTTEATHAVQVSPPKTPVSTAGASAGGGDSGGGGGAGSGVTPAVTGTHVPDATLAGTRTLAVSGSGGVTLKLACPAGEASCSGTVTLRTLGAVKASTHGRKHVLTLASGSFTVVGGQVEAVTLHLSAAARTLLVRAHVLRVQATLEAHDPAGVTHTTQTVVTLRLGKHVNKR
jgi:PKD repeat protein